MNNISKVKKHTRGKIVFFVLRITFFVSVVAVAVTGCTKKEEGRKLSLIELEGAASIEREEKTLDAKRGMELKSGDVIATGENGSARIRIDDDKFLFLGASTRVTLTAEGTADSSKTVVFVERGGLMTEVKRKLNDTSSFEVLTPNTAMLIRGTKTLTEVYEDILGAIKTNAGVIEGQVTFETIQKDGDGKPSVAVIDVGTKQGLSVVSLQRDLLQREDLTTYGRRYEWGNTVSAFEEQDATLEEPVFSEEFLRNCIAVLTRSREEDIEEGLVAENVTEEEMNAAINILNDVIDGKIELPAAVEEYIYKQSQQYYVDPSASDTPTEPESADEPTADPDPTADATTEDPSEDKTESEESETHKHELIHYDGKAATCTSPGYEPYDKCKTCDYTTYKEIPALGHEFGAWSVTTEPYPVYDGDFLSTWHAGEKTRKCTRCTETEKAVVLVTPVLMNEIFGTANSLPVDVFSDFGSNPPASGVTLQMYGTGLFYAISPSVPGNPYDWVGIDGAVLEWVEGGTALASLKAGDTLHMKITVPEGVKDVYEDTVVSIALTGAHEHVWGEGYADPDDPTKLIYVCDICGETKTEDARSVETGD